MRRKSRESAFKVIYGNLFETQPNLEGIYAEDALNQEEIEYSNKIVEVYNQNEIQIKDKLGAILKGYDVESVYKIDLALIILAYCENVYLDIPKAVAINETLEISKLYSTDKSPSFINGILKDLLK